MADYASMKVPELKKLLGERGLVQSGNKADLIARLQENDKETAEPAKATGTLNTYSEKPSLWAAALSRKRPLRRFAPAARARIWVEKLSAH